MIMMKSVYLLVVHFNCLNPVSYSSLSLSLNVCRRVVIQCLIMLVDTGFDMRKIDIARSSLVWIMRVHVGSSAYTVLAN